MIDHSRCDHERSRAARAKCRRARANGQGWPAPPLYSLAPLPEPQVKKASSKRLDDEDNYGQTPSRKDMECHKCGVERIAYRGTDPMTGILLYVGEKCLWYIQRSPDVVEVP